MLTEYLRRIQPNPVDFLISSKFENLKGYFKKPKNNSQPQEHDSYWQTMEHTLSHLTDKARSDERQRIMHDLHDNLGAMLLTMSHQCDSEKDRELSRNALRLLRDTVYFSTSEKDYYFSDILNRCKQELYSRIDPDTISVIWTNHVHKELILNSVQSLSTTCILRECFTNALKHSNPSRIQIDSAIDKKNICITVINDGYTPPSTWKNGIGTNSIDKRAKSVNGHTLWETKVNQVIFQFKFPI